MARWSALACLLVSAAASGRAAEGVEQILAKVEQSCRSAKSFHFVGTYHSGWKMHMDPAHEYRVAWDSVGTGRLRLSISSVRLTTFGLADYTHRNAIGEVPFTGVHESSFQMVGAASGQFNLDTNCSQVY